MFCPSCGVSIQSITAFCNQCGSRIPAAPGSGATIPQSAPVPIQRRALSGVKAVGIAVGLFIASWLIGVLLGSVVSLSLAPIPLPLMVISTSIWAAVDSSRLQLSAQKSSIAAYPFILFLAILALWIVTFPWYLCFRSKIIAACGSTHAVMA